MLTGNRVLRCVKHMVPTSMRMTNKFLHVECLNKIKDKMQLFYLVGHIASVNIK